MASFADVRPKLHVTNVKLWFEPFPLPIYSRPSTAWSSAWTWPAPYALTADLLTYLRDSRNSLPLSARIAVTWSRSQTIRSNEQIWNLGGDFRNWLSARFQEPNCSARFRGAMQQKSPPADRRRAK